jgi:hypothetical protein
MHEIAMHVEHNVDEFKPPFSDTNLRSGRTAAHDELAPLTPAHISALSSCLVAIDGIFEAFFSLDVKTIRNLPVVIFVRTGYAVVVLIKMYFAASAPNGEFGKVGLSLLNGKISWQTLTLTTGHRKRQHESRTIPRSSA